MRKFELRQGDSRRQEEKPIETRLYSRLEGEFVDPEGYSEPFNGYKLWEYEQEIRKVLNDNWIREEKRGFAEFLNHSILKDKVISMHPSVEIWNYQLWGVLEIKSYKKLTQEEITALKCEWSGQMMAGWGESFFSEEIDCEDGYYLFVDFGSAVWQGVMTEQELKGGTQNQADRQMGAWEVAHD